MCGIAGVLLDDSAAPHEPGALRAVNAALAHRGPDGSGEWLGNGIGLAHRRLSIVDLAGGRQPLANEDHSVHVVFNGEIYNFRELRAGLESRGHRFRSNTDTEVLVHLYEEEGPEFVGRLRGMFAFAIWDDRRRQLMLARDRVGIKPLYLWRGPDRLVFASEVKALLVHPDVSRAIDPMALDEYLAYGAVLGSRSIFQDVECFPAAHTLIVAPGDRTARPRRYWSLRFEPDLSPTADQWTEQIRATVDDAVRVHLTGDVPIGAFLSGGLDSAVVVAAAASGGVPPPTFSMGFDDPALDESMFASVVAARYGTEHYTQSIRHDVCGAADLLARHFDEPFADPAALPTLALAKAASRRVKAVLSGDGGDEAFGGYARYEHDLWEGQWRARLPKWVRHNAIGPLARAWPATPWMPRPLRAKTFLTNVALEADSAYANSAAICRHPLRRRLIARSMLERLPGHDPGASISGAFASGSGSGPLNGMLAADTEVLLPDDYLVKVDRASMAHGLEVRPPLLDHHVLELAARIPPGFKVRDGVTKWIFKRTYARSLPTGIANRPKHGFDLPLDGWMRGPLRAPFLDRVLSPGVPVARLIDVDEAARLFRAHQAGKAGHGPVLWSVLVLAAWSEQYL
jgi:asparagine synthase (glutamine-hydrolysing)